MKHLMIALYAGLWLYAKAKKQQRESGTLKAARNLKKQGVPLEIAVQMLAVV